MALSRQAALQTLTCASTIDPEVSLSADDAGVEIRHLGARLEFHHSFTTGALARRARQSNQALLRACNNRQRGIGRVLDTTAGWGADGLVLAHHGQSVTLLEFEPLVHAVLAYSLALLAASEDGSAVAQRLQLKRVHALDFLRQLPLDHDFDCIFIDPMFPAHKSSAKPAKEMQILQALTENREIDASFELALRLAHQRVVVKRPLKAAALSDAHPDFSYREKSVRFDVYATR